MHYYKNITGLDPIIFNKDGAVSISLERSYHSGSTSLTNRVSFLLDNSMTCTISTGMKGTKT